MVSSTVSADTPTPVGPAPARAAGVGVAVVRGVGTVVMRCFSGSSATGSRSRKRLLAYVHSLFLPQPQVLGQATQHRVIDWAFKAICHEASASCHFLSKGVELPSRPTWQRRKEIDDDRVSRWLRPQIELLRVTCNCIDGKL